MNSQRLLLTALACSAPLFADGSEQLGAPSISVEATGSVTFAGTGLFTQPNTLTYNLPTDANVTQVLAYWDGLDSPSDSQGETDTILIGGASVTGQRIGGSTNFFKNYWVSAYRADVTGLLSSNSGSLTVEGLDWSYANNGLALAIITDDGRTLEIADGLDYGQESFDAPHDQSEPVLYDFDASDEARDASVGIIVGGVDTPRPSVVEIRIDGALTVEAIDLLHGNLGAQFDAHTLDFTVPAGATQVSVQVLSTDRGTGPYAGFQPASFTWLHSSFSLEADGGDEPQYGCNPCEWVQNWWRWDPWCTSDNSAQTYDLKDRFNEVFDVHPWRSGVWYCGKLWHGIKGKSSWWNWSRRKLNREAVAALLNADSDMNYPYTVEEVITIYRDAVGEIDGDENICSAYWLFYDANRLGCPW